MTSVLVIFRKELKEVVRDRKTLLFMLALPVLLMPLLADMGLQFGLSAAKKAQTKTLRYAMFDQANLPVVGERFGDADGFELVKLDSRDQITGAVNRGDLDFALVVKPSRGDGNAGAQTAVELYYNSASSTSWVVARVSHLIIGLSNELRAQRLTALGVNELDHERLLEPVILTTRPTADLRATIGERFGGMLPYVFIIFCFLGALYPAIDLGAGEKERGTLETLLLVPVKRHKIVFGKFLVVFLAGTTAAVLSLVSLGVWLTTRGVKLVSGAVSGSEHVIKAIFESFGALDLILIAAMLIPTAAIFASVLLSISIYAKSFKEAQSYAAPVQIVVILPAILASVPGVELNWTWAMVPITNIALAIKELVKGTMNYEMMIAIMGSSVLLAGLLLAFCTWWFRREVVLFRQ